MIKFIETNLSRLLLFVCVICLPACSGNITDTGPDLQQLLIKSASAKEITYFIELADDDESRRQGLMHRRELAQDQGMLLKFGGPGGASIWMKNTYIPLDLIFIDEDWVIVKIVADATPLRTHPIYRDNRAIAVLEINARQALQHGISVGDRVEFDGAGD